MFYRWAGGQPACMQPQLSCQSELTQSTFTCKCHRHHRHRHHRHRHHHCWVSTLLEGYPVALKVDFNFKLSGAILRLRLASNGLCKFPLCCVSGDQGDLVVSHIGDLHHHHLHHHHKLFSLSSEALSIYRRFPRKVLVTTSAGFKRFSNTKAVLTFVLSAYICVCNDPIWFGGSNHQLWVPHKGRRVA